MNAFTAWLQNTFLNRKRYKVHHEAVIIACFYNPQGNPYRLLAFQKWYRSIKHMPHRIVECLIGPNARRQLPDNPNISVLRTDSLLWHKETLLNKLVRELPSQYRYVFWVDTDVIFTNPNWLTRGVEELKLGSQIIQPFEYCVHLKRGQLKPDFDVDQYKRWATNPNKALRHPQLWRSFCAVYGSSHAQAASEHYEYHGHTGFAWGARRELLEACHLYEKCFVGGGDHIIAHAAAGHVPHGCIQRAFADNIQSVEEWSRKFARNTAGRIGYVSGDLYHIWHGDISARNYFEAVKTFSGTAKDIKDRDENGLYVAGDKNKYIKEHYARREARRLEADDIGGDLGGFDAEFIADMGYSLIEMIQYFGQPTYTDPAYDQPALADVDTLPGPSFAIPEAPPVTPAAEPPAEFLNLGGAQEAAPAVEVAPMPHTPAGNDVPAPGDFGSTFS